MSLDTLAPTRPELGLEEVTQFLYAEARALDDRDFETWLTFYHKDAEFWMPSWDDDDRLTEDPQSEISLIWYGDRGGLEDRVFRIRTERSSATSLPEPRTSHNIANVEITGRTESTVELRFNWVTLSYRYKTTDTYFGTSFYTLDLVGRAAADPAEEGRAQERLHPPRRRHLPDLRRRRCPIPSRSTSRTG